MTLIVSWIGVDDKRTGKSIASIYISSDSRYTWPNKSNFDHGIKVFGSTTFPEIFGFCGDVMFPSIVIGQMISQIDNGILLNSSDHADLKSDKIFSYIQTSLNSYPKHHLGNNFTILHGTRFEKTFKLYKIKFEVHTQLKKEEIVLDNFSNKVFSGGSGTPEFDQNWEEWKNAKHNNHRTSRAVYHCLHKTLKEIKDYQTGGLPQIVGLYRNKNARLFGIIENEKRYIYGKESLENTALLNIEWRNENFERVDPMTSKIIAGAQRQPL